ARARLPPPDQARGDRAPGARDPAWNGTRVERLGSIRVPALVLVGKDDILTPPAFSTFLATKLPRARRVVLPGGHGFFLEQADAFNRAVLRFLKSVRSK